MIGSRLTAVGLVAAAALWIASGHFMPHESAESRAALQTDTTEARKLFRVAVMETSGAMPKLDLVNLEAQLAAAEGGLAMAEAERDRGIVRAPWTGVIGDLSVEVGQAAFSFQGRELAQLVALDPMLAVVEVAERKLASVKIGDEAEVRLVTGVTARGKVRYVAKTASQTTRTYRVEIELPNHDLSIPDGITAEIS